MRHHTQSTQAISSDTCWLQIKFGDQGLITFDNALDKSNEALVIDSISIVHNIRVSKIHRSQGWMLKQQWTEGFLKSSTINIVVSESQADNSIITLDAIDQLI